MSGEPPKPPVPAGSPSGRFVGLILISIGVLWLALTGLCTVFTFVVVLNDASSTIYFSDVVMVLSFAIPSAILGTAIYFVGRLLRPRQ